MTRPPAYNRYNELNDSSSLLPIPSTPTSTSLRVVDEVVQDGQDESAEDATGMARRVLY